FFSLPMIVRPPALVPRPETEHLVEAALAHIGSRGRSPSRGSSSGGSGEPIRVADIGAGTGCVAVAIAVNAPQAEVTATDVNPDYLQLARDNAERHHVGNRMQFLQGDLFEAFPSGETYDIIVSNPPYVETSAWDDLPPVIRKHEDPRALLA